MFFVVYSAILRSQFSFMFYLATATAPRVYDGFVPGLLGYSYGLYDIVS